MKPTHKLKAMGDVGPIIASSRSIAAAARRLGVNRATVHRWIVDGKVPRPSGKADSAAVTARAGQSPHAWAKAVRRDYELSSTEQQLLDLAVAALTMARDGALRPEQRIAAMGRYQQLVRQLDLEQTDGEVEDETPPSTVRPWPRSA